jgi:hypothetical protein
VTQNAGLPRPKPLKTLERVKGIEPSSSAWKVVGKLNDFNEPCVKWQPKTVLNPPIFATGNEMVRSDTSYGPVFVQRLRAMGIRDRPIAARSPWQNAYVERLIGSIRRECLDHMIVFGEAHLRRILGAYAAYYNEARTHRSLNKDAPLYRAIERLGAITSLPILGGLHHQYCRI